MASMEQDFTTKGKEGELRCPFASSGASNPLTPPATKENTSSVVLDPITAEFHPESNSSPPQSASGSAKCPIRFLDRHSPEEVAQYFENHKHEIPRSHEICVKRYQANSESIRKLDAKYGSLVSMIQGLGHKHQPMLQTEDDDEQGFEDITNARVEKWAEDVSSKGDEETVEREGSKDQQEREGHFERELKEIRVGESPSRPWGISVPVTELPRVDFASVREPRTRPKGTTSRGAKSDKPKGCPFDPGALDNVRDEPRKPTRTEDRPVVMNLEEATKGPNMVFTGPVFIGYSVDEAMQLLKGIRNVDS